MGRWTDHPEGPLAKRPVTPLLKPKPKQKKQSKGLQQSSGLNRKSTLRKKSMRPKPIDPAKRQAEDELLERIWARDKGKCVLCGAPGQDGHHTVPKRTGGRGILSKLIDCEILRAVTCRDCHRGVHDRSEITSYHYYKKAIETGFTARVILMELLIDEWAKGIPDFEGNLALQIRKRNQQRWEKSVGMGIPWNPDILGVLWPKILREEMEEHGHSCNYTMV